ncbi:MAG: shikimate kinase [Nitrospirota bacterium]
MKKNIVLIGFMGTGKSEVGKELAKMLGYKFIDTDELIEKREGIPVSEIFDKYGETYFRKIESEIIKDVSVMENVVISTGGGAVIRSENRMNLKRNSITICLTASPEVIYERTKDYDNRPLLKTDDTYMRIKELLKEREPYYSEADIKIDTTQLEAQKVVETIMKEMRT